MGVVGAVALLGAGCDDTVSSEAGVADMSVASVPDMTTIPPDMTTIPPDMTTPPDMVVLSGTAVLFDVVGKVPVPGVGPVQSETLVASTSFGQDQVMHDFPAGTLPGLIGCYADHFKISAGDVPIMDMDAGTIKFTGYTARPDLQSMMPVPTEINCVWKAGFYACGYGPITGGNPGPNPQAVPLVLDPNNPALAMGTEVIISGSGNAPFGAFNTSTDVVGGGVSHVIADDTIVATGSDDLTTIKYSTTADTTVNFMCGAGACSGLVLLTVSVYGAPPGDPNFPGDDSGLMVCKALGGTSIKIPVAAVQALFGPDPTKTVLVRTQIINGKIPNTARTDGMGHKITAGAGRGIFGFSPP
jgi:hypothetical protein